MADDYENAAGDTGGGKATSQHEGLYRKLCGWFKTDIGHVAEWRKEAREDFEFYSGNQWSDEDKQALAAKLRAPVVFNRTAPLVNAVVGSEINNRREVQYIPREIGDAKANEILTAAGEWFRDQTGAEDEDSDAFEDAVIGGMGWTDTRLEFEDEPDGAPVIERMDCMEMVWDCNAVKPNLADAKRMFRVRSIPYSEAEEMFPKIPKEMLHAGWVNSPGEDSKEPHDQDQADLYNGNQDEFAEDYQPKKTCTIVEARWFEKQAYYRGPDMQTMEPREYSEDQLKLLRKQIPDFPAVRQERKVVRRAFIGKQILGEPDQPLVPPGMFGWECVTGYRDKIKRQFYGIVRAAKDPQRWTNKFFSQTMFLLNSQAKGGIAAERGAFENDREAEQSWAKSDEITWLAKNALSGEKPKIMPKAPAQFPTGFFTLFQESKEEITQTTGLSPEFIGTREVDQAGVLEMQRRQSSLNVLASLFNSLRRYRKRQGKIMLFLIQNHLSDGRLIRIVGDDKKQYVPLTKEAVSNLTYDIIVDDAPTSPNEKDRTWAILMQMLPMIKDMMTPDIALELMRYSPLPASMVEQMQKKAQQAKEEAAQNPPPPSPEEIKAQTMMQKAQLDMQGKQMDLEAQGQKTAMELEATKAKTDMQTEASGIDLMIKQQEAQMKMAVDQQKLQNDMQRLAIQSEQNAIARKNANSKQTSAAK